MHCRIPLGPLGAFRPLFITIKLYFESEFLFLGGFVLLNFWFEASLYMFLIFWNFRGFFWVWFLVFENFEIVFWIRIPTFGGSVLWNFFIWGFLDDFIHSSGIFFIVPFLATKEKLAHLQMILSCRRDEFGRLDILNVKIRLLF